MASFHPVNAGFLGYVALVPLLIYSQIASGRKAFFCAWGGGYVAVLLRIVLVSDATASLPECLAYAGLHTGLLIVMGLLGLGLFGRGIV